MKENELCRMADDAVCVRENDMKMVNGIPEYRPDPKPKSVIIVQNESQPSELRSRPDVV